MKFFLTLCHVIIKKAKFLRLNKIGAWSGFTVYPEMKFCIQLNMDVLLIRVQYCTVWQSRPGIKLINSREAAESGQ